MSVIETLCLSVPTPQLLAKPPPTRFYIGQSSWFGRENSDLPKITGVSDPKRCKRRPNAFVERIAPVGRICAHDVAVDCFTGHCTAHATRDALRNPMAPTVAMRPLITLLAGAAAVVADLKLVTFAGTKHTSALCTDGTAAGYYWKPAASAAANSTWIFYLEGGGWCFSEESCQERCGPPSAPNTHDPLCSSASWPQELPVGGLFWPANDTFLQSANKVFVHYCTSDGHMGSAEQFGFHFHGADVVQAVLTDMVETQGLGSRSSPDVLLFGGGSAGARGAMVHLDYVPEMLGAVASNVEVVGFLDSPLWIDVPVFYNKSKTSLAGTTQGVHSYANVAHLGHACSAKYTGADAWKCMFGQFRMPFVAKPYLIVASQFDAFQLGYNVGHEPSTEPEKDYAQMLAVQTVQIMKDLKANFPTGRQSRISSNAVFSWACYNHDVDTSASGFDGFTCGSPGSTMHSALSQFLQLDPPTSKPPLEWIDDCSGFACGAGCNA